ncbi:MAG: peptidase [Phycisphaerae bacterium]
MVFLTTRFDFPFDTTRSLELALFRTFCVPSISALLHRTGEMEWFTQKRYDDTDIIISELLDYGYESDRGSAALRRMNQIHRRFKIANDDFLYVLSTFIYEPIRFNQRFGWRRLTGAEKFAMFYFWCEVGRRMGIKHIPEDYETYETYNVTYELEHFRFSEANRRVGTATREMFASWFPAPLRPLVRGAIHVLLDERTRKAFGFPDPHPLMQRTVLSAMAARARVISWLPRRRRPLLRTQLRQRSYPHGYRIEEIGPSYMQPTGAAKKTSTTAVGGESTTST